MIDSLPLLEIAGWCSLVGIVMLLAGFIYLVKVTYPPREEP